MSHLLTIHCFQKGEFCKACPLESFKTPLERWKPLNSWVLSSILRGRVLQGNWAVLPRAHTTVKREVCLCCILNLCQSFFQVKRRKRHHPELAQSSQNMQLQSVKAISDLNIEFNADDCWSIKRSGFMPRFGRNSTVNIKSLFLPVGPIPHNLSYEQEVNPWERAERSCRASGWMES